MLSAIPADPNALLTREQTAAALAAAGFPVRAKTLATKATRGGGPPFRRFGTKPLYRWCETLRWAESCLSPLVSSTSELCDNANHRATLVNDSDGGVARQFLERDESVRSVAASVSK